MLQHCNEVCLALGPAPQKALLVEQLTLIFQSTSCSTKLHGTTQLANAKILLAQGTSYKFRVLAMLAILSVICLCHLWFFLKTLRLCKEDQVAWHNTISQCKSTFFGPRHPMRVQCPCYVGYTQHLALFVLAICGFFSKLVPLCRQDGGLQVQTFNVKIRLQLVPKPLKFLFAEPLVRESKGLSVHFPLSKEPQELRSFDLLDVSTGGVLS